MFHSREHKKIFNAIDKEGSYGHFNLSSVVYVALFKAQICIVSFSNKYTEIWYS